MGLHVEGESEGKKMEVRMDGEEVVRRWRGWGEGEGKKMEVVRRWRVRWLGEGEGKEMEVRMDGEEMERRWKWSW